MYIKGLKSKLKIEYFRTNYTTENIVNNRIDGFGLYN